VTRVFLFSRAEVGELLPPILDQLELVEQTYLQLAAGEVEQPPKPGIHPRPNAFIHAMPAYLRARDVAAIKWVSGYPDNPLRGLPYISGLIVVNDPGTGVPIAILDAAEITAARTAAASAVCIRRWAPPGWLRAAILGCGEQGRYHTRVLRAMAPDVELHVFDPIDERARALEGAVVHARPRDAVSVSDVVVTTGPIVDDPESPLALEWLKDPSLTLPVDFDFYASAEAIAGADLFLVDDLPQFEYYQELGHFPGWRTPDGTVGIGLANNMTGHRVVCLNLGAGALDAAFADAVLTRASGAGRSTEL
jgi:ornithine cyclodeaminase/alanine dehydrogenase-like protein (mu-crystallin family)